MNRRLLLVGLVTVWTSVAPSTASAYSWFRIMVVPPPGSEAHGIINAESLANEALQIFKIDITARLLEEGGEVDLEHEPCFRDYLAMEFQPIICNATTHDDSAVTGWEYCVEGFVFLRFIVGMGENVDITVPERCKIKPEFP